MKTATATLSQLKLNPEINPRHVNPDADVGDIKAQIGQKGCIGQLWVRPAKKKGSFEIIAGSRRFAAMTQLAKDGDWKKDSKIPVNIFDVDVAEAQKLSLAENVAREPLSPADEAIGFTRLYKSGMKPADIAADYAVTEKLVLQRVAIGSLPEPILDAYRNETIDTRTAQAFAGCQSREKILKVWKELSKKSHFGAWEAERALKEGGVAGHDRRCKFVGAAAYEAEGGTVNRDLFSETEMWSDEKLLDKLFEAKIESEAQVLKDEGWSFVEIIRKNAYQVERWGRSVANEFRELSKEEKSELKELKAKHKAYLAEAK
ncbi:MAG: ParB/RepB/Spo0J family partition protein, partial [Rhodospirillales bacterium]